MVIVIVDDRHVRPGAQLRLAVVGNSRTPLYRFAARAHGRQIAANHHAVVRQVEGDAMLPIGLEILRGSAVEPPAPAVRTALTGLGCSGALSVAPRNIRSLSARADDVRYPRDQVVAEARALDRAAGRGTRHHGGGALAEMGEMIADAGVADGGHCATGILDVGERFGAKQLARLEAGHRAHARRGHARPTELVLQPGGDADPPG